LWGGQRGGSLTAVNLNFLHPSRYFSFKWLLIYPHEAEWTAFQTHCYSENVVALEIEPVAMIKNKISKVYGLQVWI
jgi:hypothetical protein